MNTQIAKFTVAPIARLTIDEQLKVWRDNTPVWNNFPVAGQSAVYILGWSREVLSSIGSLGEQPIGVILVFNGRRNTIRAYSHTERNYQLIARLPWGMFGYIRNRVGALSAYANVTPSGLAMPDYNAILSTKRGSVMWDRGVVGYYADNSKVTEIQNVWFDRVADALRGCKMTTQIWSNEAFMNFCPDFNQPQIDESTPSPLGWEEADTFSDYFDQIPYDPDRDYPMAQESTPLILTGSQVMLLDEQLVFWRWRVDQCFLAGDYDGAEFASLYATAVAGLVGLLL